MAFDTRGLFCDRMGIFAPGAMSTSMFRVHNYILDLDAGTIEGRARLRARVFSRRGCAQVRASAQHRRGRKTHGCIDFLTFDTRGLFFDSMGIFAHGAMSMIRVHSRC